MSGRVYLVGAGPGDPGLVTVKAAACLKRADAVVYDFLANPVLLAHVGPETELIYVGKSGSNHTMSQSDINRLIVKLAGEGKTVVRLKGGDPYIFGRGGEEAEELAEAGLDFEVVPGVTSAVAAPAYAGIPLTHRDFTSTVGFVTGHEDPGKDESALNWDHLAGAFGTLVFLMGVKNLPTISARLIAAGRPGDTPAALVRWGTTPDQRTLVATLADIADRAAEQGFRAPAVLVIGGVVSLRDKLNWFERLPLFGRTIMVTRTRPQASRLTARLTERGARVIECPTIEIHPPSSWQPVDRALTDLERFDWVVLTSPNGVDFFFRRLWELGLDARALGGVRLAAIGPATADKLEANGLRVDLLPQKFVAEGLVEAMTEAGVGGANILLARAAEARKVLPVELTAAGAQVTEVALYQTLPPQGLTPPARDALDRGEVHLVTFTSSSTAENLAQVLGDDLASFIDAVPGASIGPITSQTARGLGFNLAAEASTYTIDGLVDAVVEYFQAS